MREDEAIVTVRRAIAAARSGTPSVISIEGEAGFGKTRLLRALRGELDGFIIKRAFGEPDSGDVPGAMLDELLASDRSARDASVLRAVRMLQEHVDALQRESAVAFVIDDLQWADAESVRALARLARRAEGDRLLIMVASRPLRQMHSEWQRALIETDAVRITRDGLYVDEVETLLELHGGPVTGDLAERLRAHTAGNPLHLISLLRERSIADLAAITDPADLPAPLELATSMRGRIARLSTDAALLLGALAVLGDGWVPLDLAAGVAGVIDGVSARAVLVVEGLAHAHGGTVHTQIRISHAVLGAAVYEVLDEVARRNLHRAAAQRVSDEGVRLRHRVMADDGSADSQLISQIRVYAASQHASGLFREAARTLRLAARVNAPADERRHVAREAEMEALLGRAPEAIRTRLEDGDARDRLVVAMSYANQGEWHQAWTVLAAVSYADVDALPSMIASRLLAIRAWAAHGSGRPADEVIESADMALALELDPAVHGLLTFSRHQALTQTLDEEAFWRVTGLGEDRAALLVAPDGASRLAWRGMIYAMNGMLPAAIADLTVATDLIGEGALNFNDGFLHSTLALAQVAAGDMPRALISLDIAQVAGAGAPHPTSLACGRFRALVGGDSGNGEAESRTARETLMRNRLLGGIYFADMADVLVLGLLGAASEHREWAQRRLLELGDPLPLLRIRTPALWVACMGLAQGWSDHPRAAEEWARTLEKRTTAPPWRTPMVRWLRARVSTAEGPDETATYRELSASGFDEIPVLRALVARDAANSARVHDRADAAELDAASADLIGTFTYLRNDAATVPAPAQTDDPPLRPEYEPFAVLSAREQAVAALVVDGMSYAQIAKELFVTRSTVAFHLSNCYAKTNTSSRHELAQLARAARERSRAD